MKFCSAWTMLLKCSARIRVSPSPSNTTENSVSPSLAYAAELDNSAILSSNMEKIQILTGHSIRRSWLESQPVPCTKKLA